MLVPTYDALEIDWRPSTVGAADDVVPGLTLENVIDSIVRVVEDTATLVPSEIDQVTRDRAAALAPLHLP